MKNILKGIVVCVDFDGTCVTQAYPDIGRPVGAEPYLRTLVDSGAKIILFTCRDAGHLAAASNWFMERGIPLFGVNNNPEQDAYSSSRKVHAEVYIDDKAVGAPLKKDSESGTLYFDWEAAWPMIWEKACSSSKFDPSKK